MQKTKYQLNCEDCGSVWHIYTDGKSTTGASISEILEAHELNCTPPESRQEIVQNSKGENKK